MLPAPVVFVDKALAPTAVLVDTAPAPLPTVRPWIDAPLARVKLVPSKVIFDEPANAPLELY